MANGAGLTLMLIARFNRLPQLEMGWSARRKPYAPKTISLYPLVVFGFRVQSNFRRQDAVTVPNAKQDLEDVRSHVFAASGLRLASVSGPNLTAESGSIS